DHGQPVGQGLVFGNLDRLAADACLQRADRSAFDERDLPALSRRRGLRPDDERRRTVPRRADDGRLTGHLARLGAFAKIASCRPTAAPPPSSGCSTSPAAPWCSPAPASAPSRASPI